jgi:hypothetical protein
MWWILLLVLKKRKKEKNSPSFSSSSAMLRHTVILVAHGDVCQILDPIRANIAAFFFFDRTTAIQSPKKGHRGG